MKLLILILIVFSINTIAEEVKSETKSRETKQVAREAYKKAKATCLEENKDLKGRELKDCIVKKQTEAK